MPRAVKTKAAGVAIGKAGSGAKKASAPKRNKLYAMPEKIAEGTVLTDLCKVQWRIGPSIGIGGFGEIYSACRLGEKSYNYVIKCEPHGNGPLFVEMHFYMRNAKLEDIKRFQREHGLKSIGMPYMIGNGSVELKGIKHRFIVMPRYGSDITKHFVANGRCLPEGTIYRIALQMLDVFEFIHSCGYVHADLKAANILLGPEKEGKGQVYLVDYGLASHYTTKEFKPDPKKMHNGTIEYTSRDAHLGVATMRSDLEILGYNLIEWSGVQLPWVKKDLLTVPTNVQKAKEEFMSDVANCLKNLYPKGVPGAIAEFIKYVAKMEYNERPDYEKCRKIFAGALKIMKISNTGDLEFHRKADNKKTSPPTGKGRVKIPVKRPAVVDTSVELSSSDDDNDDVIFEEKNPVKKAPQRVLKTIAKRSPNAKVSAVKRTFPTIITPPRTSPATKESSKIKNATKSTSKGTTITKRRSSSLSPTKATNSPSSYKGAKTMPQDATCSSTPYLTNSHATRSTPVSAKANIKFSPAISLSGARPGKTIVNNNTTQPSRTGKTYEFNFELDVSMDANVIVNVKRKKKAPAVDSSNNDSIGHSSSRSARHNSHSTKQGDSTSDDKSSPVTRLKVRKRVHRDEACDNLHTPVVTVKKSRRVVS